MDYDTFVRRNPDLIEELSNVIMSNPTENTLRECAKAIGFRIINDYPYMASNLDLVVDHSYKIIDKYILPRIERKQQLIASSFGINNNINRQSYNNYSKPKNNVTSEDVGGFVGALMLLLFGVVTFAAGLESGAVFIIIGIVLLVLGFTALYFMFTGKNK